MAHMPFELTDCVGGKSPKDESAEPGERPVDGSVGICFWGFMMFKVVLQALIEKQLTKLKQWCVEPVARRGLVLMNHPGQGVRLSG